MCIDGACGPVFSLEVKLAGIHALNREVFLIIEVLIREVTNSCTITLGSFSIKRNLSYSGQALLSIRPPKGGREGGGRAS